MEKMTPQELEQFALQIQQHLQQHNQEVSLIMNLPKEQQTAAMIRFFQLHPMGQMQNQPVTPPVVNANPNQKQQQQQKLMLPPNQLDTQFAYQDAWKVCNPDFKTPFTSLEDACERLLPYHVVADYEEEEDDRIIYSDTNTQAVSRSVQWDKNIEAKVAEFTKTFEKQVQDFNLITQKRNEGELRAEERLMIERALLQDEQNACIELKKELDREVKAQETKLRMALGLGLAVGQEKETAEKEAAEDLLNDAENGNGQIENPRRSGGFDLNTL